MFTLIASMVLCLVASQNAYADGGDRKEINASFKGRAAKLLVKISPPILTNANLEDAYILFRLFDANTNQTIKFTSLFLSIIKDGKEVLHPDLFHSPAGLLELKIQPSQGDTVIYANKEPHLDAWQADEGGIISVKGPILLDGGLYRIHIEVFGIDSPLEIFPEDQIPKYDVYLSVGDMYSNAVQFQDHSYNTTIVSYYDKVQNLSFDPQKKQLIWSMPFNYNLGRIENESDIFIHEEVRLPRELADKLTNTTFSGSADGNELLGSSLYVDNYSSESQLFIHFLINKDQIIQLVRQSPQINKQGSMSFALSASDVNNVQTTTLVYADRGSIMTMLDWSPKQLSAKTPAKVQIAFKDRLTGNLVPGIVNYDFAIYPKGSFAEPPSDSIISKENITAVNGTDTIENIKFPADGVYDVRIEVKSISLDAGSAGTSQDKSNAGRASGVVVVPEFGSSVILAIALVSVITGVLAIQRYRHFKLQ